MPPLIGARVKRLEDEPLLRGSGRFVDDIALPGVWHGGVRAQPHPHALIKSIDKSAALAMPGVHAVLTLDDLAAVHGGAPHGAAFQLRHAARQGLGLRAAPRRGLLCRRAGGDRSGRRPLYRRRRRRAGRGRLRDAAVRRRLREARRPRAPVRRELNSNIVTTYKVAFGDADAAFAKAAHVFRRSCGSIAAAAIRSNAAASSPSCARATAASRCMPRPRRRMTSRSR